MRGLLSFVLLTLACVGGAADRALAEIGWANLQWPPTYTGSSCAEAGFYGQIWIDGQTSVPGATPGLQAQFGIGPDGTDVSQWIWLPATFNVDVGNNDEFVFTLNVQIPVGVYDYAYRYRLDGGADWYYADLNGPAAAGVLANPGSMEITETCGPVSNGETSWGMLKSRF